MKKDFFKVYIVVSIVIAIVVMIGLPAYAILRFVNNQLASSHIEPWEASQDVNSFEDCVAAGNFILESYPHQCIHDGINYVEDIGNELEKTDLIRITEPRPGSVISSPLTVKGEARGTWFFEGDFPFHLLDGDKKNIISGPVTASEDWMTEDFVPFETVIEFESPDTSSGQLVLEKDNPSDKEELDDQLVVPVMFAKTKDLKPKKISRDRCLVTGCSSQVCSDEEVFTTCEFQPQYVCYQEAICERNLDGECGWRDTGALQECLDNAKDESLQEVKQVY